MAGRVVDRPRLGRQHDDLGAHRAAGRAQAARLDGLDRRLRVHAPAGGLDRPAELVDEPQRVHGGAVRREHGTDRARWAPDPGELVGLHPPHVVGAEPERAGLRQLIGETGVLGR